MEKPKELLELTNNEAQLPMIETVMSVRDEFCLYARLALKNPDEMNAEAFDRVEQICNSNRDAVMLELQALFIEIAENMPIESDNFDFITFALKQLKLQQIPLSQTTIDRFASSGNRYFLGVYDPDILRKTS